MPGLKSYLETAYSRGLCASDARLDGGTLELNNFKATCVSFLIHCIRPITIRIE